MNSTDLPVESELPVEEAVGPLEIDNQINEVIQLSKAQLPEVVHSRLDDKFVLRFLRVEKYNTDKGRGDEI